MRKRLLIVFTGLCFLAGHVATGQTYQNDTLVNDLNEVTEATETSGDPDTAFSVITRPLVVEERTVPKQKVEELKGSEDYWYANAEPEKKEEAKAASAGRRSSLMEAAWFRQLLWLIILGSFITVVVWYLASSNVRLFRSKSKPILEEETALPPDENIFGIEYEKEIAKAASEKNYRLAVRLWYLRTLKELSERNVIAWRPETPNGAYAAHLYGSRFYTPFFRLTRNFEYVWYGGFAPPEEAYRMMQTDFQTFLNSLPA